MSNEVDRETPTPKPFDAGSPVDDAASFEEAAHTPMTNEEVDFTERGVAMMPNMQVRLKVLRLYATIRYWQAQQRDAVDNAERASEKRMERLKELRARITELESAKPVPTKSFSIFGRRFDIYITKPEKE